jgi:hypothetical protein
MNDSSKMAWLPDVALKGSQWGNLADSSRLWLYVANRLLNDQECQATATNLEAFTRDWVSHGNELQASWKLQGARVVLIALDESKKGASGCSIDASVRCMQGLGHEGTPEIDWMRRDCVLFRLSKSSVWEEAQLSAFWMARKAGLIDDNTEVMNSLCKSKGEWESHWCQSFENSWHKDMW